MNSTLGENLGQKHHTPDLSKDIRKLVESLREKAVYVVNPGRTVESKAPEVSNIVTAGLQALSGPLRDYNEQFCQLREQFRETPLIGEGAWLYFWFEFSLLTMTH